jgi:hypothetical protein
VVFLVGFNSTTTNFKFFDNDRLLTQMYPTQVVALSYKGLTNAALVISKTPLSLLWGHHSHWSKIVLDLDFPYQTFIKLLTK